MIGVIVSFISLLTVSWVLELGVGFVRKLAGKPFPKPNSLVKSLFVNCGITVVITLGISLALNWTGFTDSQFYRPSTRNFEQHQKLGLEPEDVYFTSSDGTRLFGWFIAAEGNPVGTIIHLHGSDANISYTIRNSHWLSEYGFNVFAFDYRGYGRSEGEPSRQGVLDDAVAAIEYVRSRSDVEANRIGLWGQSLGGQLAIVAAHKAGPSVIGAVVAEATYGSHSHQAKDKMAQMGPLWLIQWAVWLTTSDRFDAEQVVGDLSPTPVLIVHGTADRGVLPYQGERLFAAAIEPKEIWRIEGAEHLMVFTNTAAREQLVEYFKQSLQE